MAGADDASKEARATEKRAEAWGKTNSLTPTKFNGKLCQKLFGGPGYPTNWVDHPRAWHDADGRLALTTELYSMDSGYREGDLRAMRDWARGIGWTVQNRGTKESFWYPGKTTLFVLREVRAVIPFREETTYDRRP